MLSTERANAVNRTILLVDDDAKLRALLVEYLEGYGFRVLTLPDGSAVRETIRAESPDIIILDVNRIFSTEELIEFQGTEAAAGAEDAAEGEEAVSQAE